MTVERWTPKFVANEEDKLHCTQATLIMAWEALTGARISMNEAELASGFRQGFETWPYTMIAWLAEQGANVVHVDALDPIKLSEDARGELERSGLDPTTIDLYFRISDFDLEARSIKRALATGRVDFHVRVPEPEEILVRLEDGWLPIVSCNSNVLNGGDSREFDGHVVLVTDREDDVIVVQDPGPPAHEDVRVSLRRLRAALRSPSDTSGTLTFVSM